MAITVELNERELHLLAVSLWERDRSIRRKRSWRASEKAASLADVHRLERKLEAAKGAPLLLGRTVEAAAEAVPAEDE